MKLRWKRLAAVFLASLFIFTGCQESDVAEIYDNDKKIAQNSNSFNLMDIRQVALTGHFSANVGRMEGMDTVWICTADEDMSMEFTYLIKVYAGKLKLVLITPDNEVSTIYECEEEMPEAVASTVNLKAGENRIKLVAAQGTEFDIDLSATEGKFLKIGF